MALILIGTNIGRDKRRMLKKPENKKQLVQFMEGKVVKCEVVGDKDIGTVGEDEVYFFFFLRTHVMSGLV